MPEFPDPANVQVELGWMPCLADVRDMQEDWTGVTSTAERRRLQNRLNQRAYRRRQKRGAARNDVSSTTTEATDLTQNSTWGSMDKASLQILGTGEALEHKGGKCLDAQVQRQAAIRLFAQLAYTSYRRGVPEPTHLPVLIQYNVHSALLRNAETLGLSELWHDYEAVSPFCQGVGAKDMKPSTSISFADWPATLRPTPLQQSLEHHPWIDLFPLPRMRDNFLRALEDPTICDEDELCYDLAQFGDADKPCLIVWGHPWDPRSWEASLPLLRKWGWLLDGCWEIFEATNYWREKRGELRLTQRDILKASMHSVQRRQKLSGMNIEILE